MQPTVYLDRSNGRNRFIDSKDLKVEVVREKDGTERELTLTKICNRWHVINSRIVSEP